MDPLFILILLAVAAVVALASGNLTAFAGSVGALTLIGGGAHLNRRHLQERLMAPRRRYTRPGRFPYQYAAVTLVATGVALATSAVVGHEVPISALFRDNGSWAVFAIEDGMATLKHVEVGRRNTEHAQVLGGLSAGGFAAGAQFAQLPVADAKDARHRAAAQLFGLGEGAGQVPAFPEIVNKDIGLLKRLADVTDLDDNDRPGHHRA